MEYLNKCSTTLLLFIILLTIFAYHNNNYKNKNRKQNSLASFAEENTARSTQILRVATIKLDKSAPRHPKGM